MNKIQCQNYSFLLSFNVSSFTFQNNSWDHTMRNTLKDQAFNRYLGFDRGTEKEGFNWSHTRYFVLLKINNANKI